MPERDGGGSPDPLDEAFPTVDHSPLLKPEPIEWLLRGTWLSQKVNYVAGPEKAGKSRLLHWLLLTAIAGADNRLGIDRGAASAVPERWLYLAAEESPGLIAERLRIYGDALGVAADLLPISYHDASMMRLERYDVRKKLERFLVLRGYDGLIIDPLRRVHMADENDNTAMAGLNATFRRWSNQLGVTQIIVHHTGSTGLGFDSGRIASWLRGATDFAAALDAASFVWRPRVSESKVLLYRAGRFPPSKTLELRDLSDPPHGRGWRLAVDVPEPEPERR